jgi:hypothetical protein
MEYSVIFQLLVQFLKINHFSQANNDSNMWYCEFELSKFVWMSDIIIMWYGPEYSNAVDIRGDTLKVVGDITSPYGFLSPRPEVLMEFEELNEEFENWLLEVFSELDCRSPDEPKKDSVVDTFFEMLEKEGFEPYYPSDSSVYEKQWRCPSDHSKIIKFGRNLIRWIYPTFVRIMDVESPYRASEIHDHSRSKDINLFGYSEIKTLDKFVHTTTWMKDSFAKMNCKEQSIKLDRDWYYSAKDPVVGDYLL